MTSAGAVELGSVAVGGDYAVTGSTTVHGGLTDFTGTVVSVGPVLTINGTADFHANALSLTTLTLSGTLQSTAAVAVSEAFYWHGGTCCRGRGCDGAGDATLRWRQSSQSHWPASGHRRG